MVMANDKELLKSVLSLWEFNDDLNIIEENIEYETERKPHIWTVNKDYILKMTNTESEMKNNIHLINMLSKGNIPSQRIVPSLDGKEYICVENRFYALFTKIKGTVLKDYFEGDYLNRGFYLGKCISNLHNALQNITENLNEGTSLWNNNMIDELNGWVSYEIDKYIPSCTLAKEDIELFNTIYAEVKNNFENLYSKLPRQAIHRDMHGENVIFKDAEIVGYIDFDLSQINARIYDICYLCTGSLSTIFNDVYKRDIWIGFAENVIKGYDSISTLTDEERHSMKYMFYLIELIMIAYFAQNNYSDIADTNIKMINWISLVWDDCEV